MLSRCQHDEKSTTRQKQAASARKPLAINSRVADVSLTVDDHSLPIVIHIPVAIATLLDHDGLVTIPVVALPDNIMIAIAIPIMHGSDGYTGRADTHTNLFRASRHCDANSDRCDSDHCKTLEHDVLLKSVNQLSQGQSRLAGMVPPATIDPPY
jgi:hypothetical protein